MHAPLSGEVLKVNQELEDVPETVNDDPYNRGWIIQIKISDTGEIKNLLDFDKYKEFLAHNK